MRCGTSFGKGSRLSSGAEVPGVPRLLPGGGLEPTVKGSTPLCRVPVETWFAGLIVNVASKFGWPPKDAGVVESQEKATILRPGLGYGGRELPIKIHIFLCN